MAGLISSALMLTRVAAGAVTRAVRCCVRTGQDTPRACGVLAARQGLVSGRFVHTKDASSPPELTKGADLLEITKGPSDSSPSPSPTAAATLGSTSPPVGSEKASSSPTAAATLGSTSPPVGSEKASPSPTAAATLESTSPPVGSEKASPSPTAAATLESTISIDTSGLYAGSITPKKELPKEMLTELGMLLYAYLRQFGPISVADYMDLCLAHPRYGYYRRQQGDKIGKEGDFITSPEISQMFGELIGIWSVASWEKLGLPQGVRLAEIGPGKGTLMKDLLRSSKTFKSFTDAVESVHMVETSLMLRGKQAAALGGTKAENGSYTLPAELGFKPVSWHNTIDELPEGPLLLIGQELLDALPVHQFEYTEEGWRERMVVTDTDDNFKYHFNFKLSDKVTPAVQHLEKSEFMPDNPQVGMGIEVCPLGLDIFKRVAERIGKFGGAALFIDYGENETQADTVRGLKAHSLVDVRSEPGLVDLSADVDFSALRMVAEKVPGVRVHGPVPQGQFLSALGIEVRLNALLDAPGLDDRQALDLYDSYRRLVDPEQMGRKYKVIAIVAEKHQGPAVGL